MSARSMTVRAGDGEPTVRHLAQPRRVGLETFQVSAGFHNQHPGQALVATRSRSALNGC
jgi:hypothetical protein